MAFMPSYQDTGRRAAPAGGQFRLGAAARFRASGAAAFLVSAMMERWISR